MVFSKGAVDFKFRKLEALFKHSDYGRKRLLNPWARVFCVIAMLEKRTEEKKKNRKTLQIRNILH